MDQQLAVRLAEVLLAHVQREYPWSPGHLVREPQRLAAVELHPAFHGSLDWHSCVHSHWALAWLKKRGLLLRDVSDSIDAVFDENLRPDAIEAELAYLRDRPGFERPYGWVWALWLAEALRGTRWSSALDPLEGHFTRECAAYVATLTRPNRYGLHGNTAFALTLALQHAELSEPSRRKARDLFLKDRDYPAHLEPMGSDFLSAALTEAALMKEVLDPDEFSKWISAFLPGFGQRRPPSMFAPAGADGDAHLHGFNLSRAWSLQRLGLSRGEVQPLIDAALPHVGGGDYMADHWLATFLILALDPATGPI